MLISIGSNYLISNQEKLITYFSKTPTSPIHALLMTLQNTKPSPFPANIEGREYTLTSFIKLRKKGTKL